MHNGVHVATIVLFCLSTCVCMRACWCRGPKSAGRGSRYFLPSLLGSFRLVSFQLEISFLSIRVLLWNCIRGLQYISSHPPLVARMIECLELAFASCTPCLSGAVLSGAPPCQRGSGPRSYQFIYQFSSISPINPAPIHHAGDSWLYTNSLHIVSSVRISFNS
jgi:hypothetical protein